MSDVCSYLRVVAPPYFSFVQALRLLGFHFCAGRSPTQPKCTLPPPLVSTLPLQVEVQGFLLSIQQRHRTAQELTAAGDGLELQDEEAQAEHGAHLLQFTGAELQTLPRKQNDPQ